MAHPLETLIKNIKVKGHESEVVALISTTMCFDEVSIRKHPFAFKWRNQPNTVLSELDLKFPGLSANSSIDWSPELILKFAQYFDWRLLPFTLSKNRQYIGIDCLEKIKSILNPALVDQWKLVENIFIMIHTYQNWDFFDDFVFINQSFFLNCVWLESPITETIIDHYLDKWDWDVLSACMEVEFTAKMLKKYADKWNWKKITDNSCVPWTMALVRHFKNDIDWIRFSEKNFFDENKNKLLPMYQKLMNDFRPFKVLPGKIFDN